MDRKKTWIDRKMWIERRELMIWTLNCKTSGVKGQVKQIDRKRDMDIDRDMDRQMIWTLTCKTSGAKGKVGDVDFCKEKHNQSFTIN